MENSEEAAEVAPPPRSRANDGSLTWRPSTDGIQMPMMHGNCSTGSPSNNRRRSVIFGQTHRIPSYVMWAITLLTALCMALINFVTILAIEGTVKFKFHYMQDAIMKADIWFGITVLVLLSAFYSFAGVCMIQALAPQCGGSGLPENKCYLNGSTLAPNTFTKQTLGVRMATTILANAAGFPVGREGPTVVIGSNTAFLISKLFVQPWVRECVDMTHGCDNKTILVDEQRFSHASRIACAVGGACAMAMIFNAPFGGLLYMFEEITSVSWPLELTFRVFVATMCCSLTSYWLCNLIGTSFQEYVIYVESPRDLAWDWIDIPMFIIMAILLGVITSLHTRGMLAMAGLRQRMAKRLKRFQPWALIVEVTLYGSFCALFSALASLLGNCEPDTKSGLQYVRFNCEEGQHNQVASLLVTTSHSAVKLLFSSNNSDEIHPASSLLAFLVYYFLNVCLTGLPVPGGAFTATMLLGGLAGRCFGTLTRALRVGAANVSGIYAVVGSAAMLCGFKQMTLSSVLIVVECVNDMTLAPVVMLGVAVSIAVNWRINRRGHDEEQIFRKKLPFLEGDPPHNLDRSVALDICEWVPPGAVLPPEAHSETVRQALAFTEVSYFPVRDGSTGPCIGIMTREYLEEAFKTACGLTEPSFKPAAGPTELSTVYTTWSSIREDGNPDEAPRMRTLIGQSIPVGDVLPLYKVMDPSPFTVVEDMPVPRMYPLFSKAGESAILVTSIRGELRGVISRAGLIAATRQHDQ